ICSTAPPEATTGFYPGVQPARRRARILPLLPPFTSSSNSTRRYEMKKLIGSTAVLAALALLLALALPVLSQDHKMEPKKAEAAPAAAPAPGLKPDALHTRDDAQKKLIQLAEAMPADKYTWHPEGARSVGEVFNHVAGGNYFIPTLIGVKMPA